MTPKLTNDTMMDYKMEHICNEIGINTLSRARMLEYGICAIQNLMQIQERIKMERRYCLQTDVFKNLLLVVKWIKGNPHRDIMRDFDLNVFEMIFEKDVLMSSWCKNNGE